MGNGVAMATKRSTRDVKAQRGLGRGKREKGKEEKVYVRLQLLCFPMKRGPGKVERDRVRWQLLLAATTSGSQSAHRGAAQPGETTPLHAALAQHTAGLRNKFLQTKTPLEI